MIGVVLLAHGDLSRSLIEAVELIAGPQEQVRCVGLKHGDGIDEFEQRCRHALHEVDSGEGALVFADFLGGTPSNVASRMMRDLGCHCIVGMNMPMLIEALTNRSGTSDVAELAAQSLEVGRMSLLNLGTHLQQMNEISDDF